MSRGERASKGAPSPAGSGMEFLYFSHTAAGNRFARGIQKKRKMVHALGAGGAGIFVRNR